MSGGLFDRLDAELNAREKTPGLLMSDVLAMPDDQRKVINWMIRRKTVELPDLARFLERDEQSAQDMMAGLIELGYVRSFEKNGVLRYQVRLAPKRGRTMPENLWQALDDKVEE